MDGRELAENAVWGRGFKIAKNRHVIFERSLRAPFKLFIYVFSQSSLLKNGIPSS